ncbi:transposase [Xanthomonas oryzae pv. oryzicola]|nr:transposase [Xanthomonas oryzae pv. oryzicola]
MPPHSEQIVSRICGALFRGSLAAAIAAQTISVHAVFLLVIVYIVAFFHWMSLGSAHIEAKQLVAPRFGFGDLLAHAPLRRLTTFRLLTACAHSATLVAIPLLAARVASAHTAGVVQSIFLLAVALGFAAGHWQGTRWRSSSPPSFVLIWIGCIGSSAAWIAVALTGSIALGIIACAAHGFALYCLRMAGVLVGRLVTPTTVFGQAVLIGDTISRFGSALVGVSVSMFLIRLNSGEPRLLLVGGLALIAASAVLVAGRLWRDIPRDSPPFTRTN